MTNRLKPLQCSPFFVPGLMFVFAVIVFPIVFVAVSIVVWALV